MKEIQNIWFKQKSVARDWLVKNLNLSKSFSKTFRTTGGTFRYYSYEFVLKGCIIEECDSISIGSFQSHGGNKLRLCENHVKELIQLQNPPITPIVFPFFLKYGLPNILVFIMANPLLNDIFSFARLISS